MPRSLFNSIFLVCSAASFATFLGIPQLARADSVAILSTSGTDRATQDTGTIWRYFETWQQDVARVDDKLVDVNIFDNRQKADGGKGNWELKQPRHPLGSPFPADGWQKSEFDDSDWVRSAGPFPSMWRGLSLICMRGKFQVSDPAQISEMSLTVKFQGGVIAYLNGTEVGRASMPDGKIDNTTLATDYPQSAYVTAKGVPIPQIANGRRVLAASDDITQIPYELKDADTLARFKSRGRTMEIKVPAVLLKKGVNVLSIEIHHAAADPIMYLTQDTTPGNRGNLSRCWNRAECEAIELSSSAAQGAIVPNISRPDGLQVWTEESMVQINASRYGDPTESLKPIQLCGARNGTYAGQVLVGARASLKDIKATAGDLTFGNTTIPASAMQIYYRDMASDALEVSPPAQPRGSIIPIWLSVKVPKDAAPGKYSGTLSVEANGQKPVAVPVELKVVGDWVVPDAKDFTTFVGALESADSVAMQYNEPLWSESHWKHIDAVYELLGEIGVKDVYLPLIAKTHLANEQSMVRWIVQPDGTYTYDFSVLERYLDTAMKHLGKPQVVCLYLHDYGFRIDQNANRGANSDSAGGLKAIKPTVTAFDPATGKLSEFQPPDWGTPEALTFWKPVIDKTLELLAKRGVEKAAMFGMGANNWARPETIKDLKTLYPNIPWANRTHYFAPNVGDGKDKQTAGLSSVVAGVVAVSYDPDDVGLKVGWASPRLVIDFPRLDNVEGAVFNEYLPTYRIFAEGVMLSGGMRWNSLPPSHGVGHIGADFWPVLKDSKGTMHNLADRYVFWHSLSLADVVPSIVAPGVNGPVGTVRHLLMREALQESEARVLVQNALLDPQQVTRMGPELTTRCTDLCAERTNVLRYYSKFAEPALNNDYARVFSERQWESMSEKLYQAASDVTKATAKN